MKNFFKTHTVLAVILAVVILLAAVWTPIIITLTKSGEDSMSPQNSEPAKTDVSSYNQEDNTQADNSSADNASQNESSKISVTDGVQSAAESEDTKSSYSSTNQGNTAKPQKNPDLPELSGGAKVNESPLANTYKLLTLQKKLTIGYLGGSITSGSSAKKIIKNGAVFSEDGSMLSSYVNRVSAWFSEKFPDAKIETVNAGLSDTHSQFGLYRLEKTLMNTNGHDMPDLVFIEFTTNDWIYGEHTAEVIEKEVESIVVNIRKINEYADIVFVATNTSSLESSAVKQAHKAVADHYGLPFIDVGSVLQDKKNNKGVGAESASNGTLYYTVDNLHPSALGYSVYLQEISNALKEHLDGLNLKSNKLYSYKDNAVEPIFSKLISPVIISADKLKISGKATYYPLSLTAMMYGTSVDKASSVRVADSYVKMENGSSVTASFSGNYLGVLLLMSENNTEIEYSIDGGKWEDFAVDSSTLSHQRYSHTQAFSLKCSLSDGKHTVVIKAKGNSAVVLGGLLTAK